MHTHLKRKDAENVIICPKCNTQNHSSQKQCGKCGYIFPSKEKSRDKKKQIPNMPFSAPIAQAPEQETQEEQEPQIPKNLTNRGKNEGLISVAGRVVECPRCASLIKPDATRCPKCGYKTKKN
ncbi:MAG: zinc ribbon domain-containing protein [Candidatus Micrarchaeia archaeon]